ncbi:MAG TPA: Na/Pi cotransporter family protein, partial [Gammaproteobacteria bacterium]|nr:Na/Pi cotransporter family protein [Gammaproteobacteria bacterium]
IFLFGMLALEQGFQAFTGGTLERILRRATSSRWKSLGFGVVTTTLMQSSSLVSVITISFLSAGLITLAAGIGIIFGANLGTTTGAWLIAGFGLKVKISAYAMPMLVFGIVLIFQSSKKLNGIGYILAGLGFLFLGIHYMKEGFEAFKDTIDLTQFSVSGYPGLFLFAAIGIAATVIMQSSHATLVLIITALAAHQITYDNALALAIGANVGTTITAILGSLSSNESGKRLAGAHLIFNLVTGLLAIVLIYHLIDLVDWIAREIGIAADDYTLKLAVFHTIFNLMGILVMLPFVNPLVKFLERVIPEKRPQVDRPRYLSEASAEFPDTAIEAVRKETRRVYKAATRIIIATLGLKQEEVFSDADLEQVVARQSTISGYDIDAEYEKHIKPIYSAIIAFISDTTFSRRDEQGSSLQWMRDANRQVVEAVKDTKHLQKNLLRYLGSDHARMHDAYNRIRVMIATTIRELEDQRQKGGDEMDMLALDALKLRVDEAQESINNMLTELIGRREITPEMGSSLLNDSNYAYNVSINLVRAAEKLFATEDEGMLRAARGILLDRDERTEAIEHEQQPTSN